MLMILCAAIVLLVVFVPAHSALGEPSMSNVIDAIPAGYHLKCEFVVELSPTDE